jgi:hypothetical protein
MYMYVQKYGVLRVYMYVYSNMELKYIMGLTSGVVGTTFLPVVQVRAVTTIVYYYFIIVLGPD